MGIVRLGMEVRRPHWRRGTAVRGAEAPDDPPRRAGFGTVATCAARFGNAVNFQGEPFLPGNDMLAQYPVAR